LTLLEAEFEVHDLLNADPNNPELQRDELSLQDELGNWLANEEDQWRQRSRVLVAFVG